MELERHRLPFDIDLVQSCPRIAQTAASVCNDRGPPGVVDRERNPASRSRRLEQRDAADGRLECGQQLVDAFPTVGTYEIARPVRDAAAPLPGIVVVGREAPE